jgi:two-component system, NarL family, nitrate/nitrite response regulator NarL
VLSAVQVQLAWVVYVIPRASAKTYCQGLRPNPKLSKKTIPISDLAWAGQLFQAGVQGGAQTNPETLFTTMGASMQLDKNTHDEKHFLAGAPAHVFDQGRVAGGDDARPIRVFIISDFQMLLQVMAQAVLSQPKRYVLQGCATVNSGPQPWGELVPDVILLDLDMDPERAMVFLKTWRDLDGHRVLLFSCQDNPALIDRAIREGGNGLIGRHCAPEHFLRAIDKVCHGEVWLDSATTARLVGSLARRDPQGPQDTVEATLSLLTNKEQTILCNLLHNGGEPAKVIASRLFISESTLRNHLTSIYEKMGVRNRNGLISHAVQTGLADRLAPVRITRQQFPGFSAK